MTRLSIALGALFLIACPATAEGALNACSAALAELETLAADDFSDCAIEPAAAELKQCQQPSMYTAERPASHVALILDVSGSMAGSAGKGGSKMDVAKSEALTFLEDLEDDVPVGLIVYGHEGNNTASGKEESCASAAWAHQIGDRKNDMAASIAALQPTGWTPLGGVLEFTQTELAKLKPHKDELSTPVVYLISDGEETCDGDPVAAAKALHESGVRATINVIGFGVNEETREQLEAISEAGGGRYFPAEDSNALKRQMKAIRDSEASAARLQYCAGLNVALAMNPINNARREMAQCMRPKIKLAKSQVADAVALKEAATTDAEKACANTVYKTASELRKNTSRHFTDAARAYNTAALEAGEASRTTSIENARPADE